MPAKNKKRTKKKLKRSYGQEKKNLLPNWQEYLKTICLLLIGKVYTTNNPLGSIVAKKNEEEKMICKNYSCQHPYVTSLCWSFPKASRNTKNAIAKHQSELYIIQFVSYWQECEFSGKRCREKNSVKIVKNYCWRKRGTECLICGSILFLIILYQLF